MNSTIIQVCKSHVPNKSAISDVNDHNSRFVKFVKITLNVGITTQTLSVYQCGRIGRCLNNDYANS
jgi:hypothetical protein